MKLENNKPLTALLVDDDLEDQQLFSEALANVDQPIQLTMLNNGVELMDRLFSDAILPDMIFLDLNMPMMNGEECLQDIRDEERFDDIPILIYSNSFDRVQIKRLFEMGANRYLQKPNSFNELVSSLEKTIEHILLSTAQKKEISS